MSAGKQNFKSGAGGKHVNRKEELDQHAEEHQEGEFGERDLSRSVHADCREGSALNEAVCQGSTGAEAFGKGSASAETVRKGPTSTEAFRKGSAGAETVGKGPAS